MDNNRHYIVVAEHGERRGWGALVDPTKHYIYVRGYDGVYTKLLKFEDSPFYEESEYLVEYLNDGYDEYINERLTAEAEGDDYEDA